MFRSLYTTDPKKSTPSTDHGADCEDHSQVLVCVLSPSYSTDHLEEFIDDLLSLRFTVLEVRRARLVGGGHTNEWTYRSERRSFRTERWPIGSPSTTPRTLLSTQMGSRPSFCSHDLTAFKRWQGTERESKFPACALSTR